MATVFLARLRGQAAFSRIVAVKALHPHYAKEEAFQAMFLDEARIVSRVRHPNVVPTIDVLEQDGDLYLIMDYVHGQSLSRLLGDAEKLGEAVPVGIACSILIDTLEGLHAAHEATGEDGKPLLIVHRDVSPQNILVGVNGSAQVADFGIAKAVGRMSEKFSMQSSVKGKAGYMAPEQVRGKTDRRSDVYAAGVVLWETLTGKKLFTGDSFLEIVTKAMDADVPPPSSLRADVPTALDDVVKRALQHDVSRRFQTAREMAVAIEQSGVRAGAREVGGWVKRIAAGSLEERAAMITRIESAKDDDGGGGAAEAESANDPASEKAGRRSRIETAIERPIADGSSAPVTHFTGTISERNATRMGRRGSLLALSSAVVVGSAVGIFAFVHRHASSEIASPSSSQSAPQDATPPVATMLASAGETPPPTPSTASTSATPASPKPRAQHRAHATVPARSLGDAGANCHWEQLPDEQGIMIPKKVCP